MTEVCHNVAVEPHLQPLTGEKLQGASSIAQDGDLMWQQMEWAFFDVFNQYALEIHTESLL